MSRRNSSKNRGYSAVIKTSLPSLSVIGLHIIDERLTGIVLLPEALNPCGLDKEIPRQFVTWLDQYLLAPCDGLPDIELSMTGTPFQQRVWRALQGIGCGERMTYGQLACQLGSGARAVAAACRANPLPLVVPCHRVVSATGIGGYMGKTEGWAIDIKRGLLEHESH